MADKRYTSFDELPLTLTVPEVAEVLDIGRNTAYEIVRSGDLPSRDVNKQDVCPNDTRLIIVFPALSHQTIRCRKNLVC